MKLERPKTPDADPSAAAGGQSPGQMLQQERERRGLTVQQAAEDLHLDRWIVEAIEADRFLALGAPVYARGHLRKYAALVGLSPDLIVGCYNVLAGTPAAPLVTTTSTAHRARRKQRPWALPALLIVVVAGVVAGVWYRWTGSAGGDASTPAAAVNLQMVGVVAAPLSAPAASTPAVVDPVAANSPLVAEEPAAGAAQQVSLRLEFSAPSWAEVHDARGQRLMSELGQPGQPRSLRGVAPLRVVIGVAAAVTARVNERAIVVPRSQGKDASRFVVAADGSVR